MTSHTRLLACAAAGALALSILATNAPATSAPTAKAAAPKYSATITRTAHGIPHITAKNFGSLGFGAGYAAAQTSTCILADVLLTGRAQRSRYLGPKGHYDDGVAMNGTNLQADALVTDLHNRKVVEKLLADPKAGPGSEARQMVTGYAAGINKYIRASGGSKKITDPACKGAPYIRPNITAMDVWYGVYMANILASTGNFLKQIVGATPPSLSDPGLPSLATFGIVPPELPTSAELKKALGKDPKSPFGSNATAVGRADTSTGKGMLLGNPHFPWNGRYRFSQQQLTIPGKYNVAGASLIGSPVVNIGWNRNVAWSHTVSTAYRFTPYEYRTVLSPFMYLSANGLIKQLEKRVVKVVVKNPNGSLSTVTEDMYRTPQGYVIDDPATLMGWTPLSFFAIRDANGEQLRTIDTFLNMGKATSVRDLIKRQDAGGGMPWVNTTAADRNGDVVYADHSVVPNVPNSMANVCMTPIGRVTQQLAGLPGLDGTFADGICKWKTDADAQRPGIFGTKNLPAAYRSDWVMNANDSYWLPNPAQRLTGYAKIIGCENCQRTLRTKVVSRYVMDRVKVGKVTPAVLRGFEHQNRVMGAEVMGTAALVKVCQAANGGDACPVLAAWDKHSNITSRGNHIFEEFVKRLPGGGLLGGETYWKVPFSSADPMNTPRDLDVTNGKVIKAMKEAIAYLRSKNIPMNATWGSVQVAGDRGAPPIPLGGGSGDDAGNANALAGRGPSANGGFLKPITYGSSHIQAISFLANGLVDAKTILTYGQSDNPRSPWSKDQTLLFSQKKWVSFPWTTAQIKAQKISAIRISGN
ncbi:penicillin acylase family protein [Nocardioides marmoriginsengisoli]|uniref:penicillin acylase family protein n=1 Tax=Nocardioides marmoriginsengisoli TaxID=661483 RepID=UPI001FEB2C25|nr:penicillin acylase family protein [Nocardioides marmoriginsengisoli]